MTEPVRDHEALTETEDFASEPATFITLDVSRR
jgi:hypothetical protein